MTDVEVRLDSLRTAAAVDMQQASRAISDALEAVQAEVTALYVLGLPAGGVGAFSASYVANIGLMQEWPFKLMRFATNLEQAADDIQQAISQSARTIAPLVLPFYRSRYRWRCGDMALSINPKRGLPCPKLR